MSGPVSPIALPKSAGRDLPPWLADFYRGYVNRDPALLDAVMHDDVVWRLAGPGEQFEMETAHRGKAAAIELVTRIIPCFFHITGFEFEHLVVQGDLVATYGHLRARQRDTGRSLCFRSAHFLRFRDGRLVSFRGIADTFDMAEQMVGHPIDATKRIETVSIVPDEDALLTL
ncbi:nuclear transport factor 2 family protein [Pseudorhodoplanes sp.]|jgi:ketosteroid isomerase-like protein|uniref:nuclear transport factor 2 family protein n=1 Tax=Pseudorhodoplanes sp. TaxID=1934341 RepID=UPI002C12EB0C|nr:nuclear transport factor 2 family protein [Pseudorhodoplanes sp.]HWV44256.1 nuclear transport factor 2 family protein [Pseudorhodoplanes sp.]